MMTENEKNQIAQFFMPRITEDDLDKASVAGICRLTAERKLHGLSVPLKHVSFAWGCMEYHETAILTRLDVYEKTMADISKALKSGADFCELYLDESLWSKYDFEQNFYTFADQLVDTLPLGKTFMAIPYHALDSREKTGLFLRLFSPYRGLSITQDGWSVDQKLTAVYRIFETIRETGILPPMIHFDIMGVDDCFLLAQNILRLKEQILKGLDFQIGFYVNPKMLLKNGLLQ